jgi:predicted RNA-binding protein YlxR (DUF448 family)
MNAALVMAILNIALNIFDRAKEKQGRGAQLTEDEREMLKAEQRAEEARFDRLRGGDTGGNG